MATVDNILQSVTTWQPETIAYFRNLCPIASKIANAKFKDFQKRTANLGSSVSFPIAPDSVSSVGLVASFQASEEKKVTLTCDQARNVSRVFTAQDYVFNLDATGYMSEFGMADVEELANVIENNFALNANSSVPVMQIVNGQSVPTGALHTESGPYRFYGNGVDPINSYQQLVQAKTNFNNLGWLPKLKMILPDTIVPSIIGQGLNQFVPSRNEETAMSWELGAFAGVEYFSSNLLPIHTAGTIGNSSGASQILTVVSTNDPTGQNITQITCSTPVTTDSEAIFSGDLAEFVDGVSGQTNARYLTHRGHVVSAQPVQVRMTADAESSGGSVVLTITPALVSAPGPKQNINTPIVAGMQLQVMPSHKCGLLIGADAFYIAMPQLPDEIPFPTASKTDEDTGLSLRMYYGSKLGENQQGMVTDATWGSLLLQPYSQRLLLPLTV